MLGSAVGLSYTEKFLKYMTHKSTVTILMLQVIVIESIPLLVNGKVDRQALLKMYENTNNNGKNK